METALRRSFCLWCGARNQKGPLKQRPPAGTNFSEMEMQPRQEWFYGFPQPAWIPEKHGVPAMEPDPPRGGFSAAQSVLPARSSVSERQNIPRRGQALAWKIFRFSEVRIRVISALVPPGKGAARDRHEPCGGMRRDAAASGDPSPDENVRSVRRNRVVLAPRPWRQADGLIHR